RAAALLRVRRGEPRGVRGVSTYVAGGGGDVVGGGVPRRARNGALQGHPARDRRGAAARAARAGRARRDGGGRLDEVPREGGERRRQARRVARRAARRGARVPAPAAGRAALGRGPE